MGIYRGPGGTGDAVNDASSEALITVQAKDAALAAQAAAEAAQAAAELAETNAETAETNAETAETNAETAATNAASSASAASTSASNAATSATNAANSATAAQTAETNAETAETNAAASASAASTSASNAATSATNASNSASAAATSATNASNSASAAATSATNAANSATAAQTAQTAAELAETNAETAEANAETAEANAAASASAAATSASNASTSASNAATSATNASNSASAAATSATNASNSASAAATSASNAATSESNAASSASAAAASYDSFDDRYLGAKSSAPTLDNDGNTLLVGALYYDTVSSSMKVWSGSAWLDAYASLSGALVATNNLSDLNNTATARDNLGVEIGVDVQAYDADTAKLDVAQSWSAAQSFNAGVTLGDASGDALTINSSAVSIPNGLNFDSNTFVIDATNNRVGVGTASPSYALHIAGQSAYLSSGASTALTFIDINSAYGTIRTGIDASGVGYFGSVSNFALALYTNNSERLRIDTSGNVGIGTSSPNSKLAVGGNPPTAGAIAGVASAGGYSLSLSDNVNNSLYITHPAGNAATIATDSGGALAFATNGTSEKMRIDTSGNVGIGTSSPTTRLSVVSGTNAGISVNDGTVNTIIYNSTGGVGSIGTTTNHPVDFYTNNSARMRIDSSGNVGIGTSSPQKKFVVSDAGAVGMEWSPTDYTGNMRQLAYNRSTSAYVALRTEASQHEFYIGGTERMRIDSSGNVSIGATSGNGLLNVVVPSAASSGQTPFFVSDGTQASFSIQLGTELVRFTTGTSDALTIETNSAERMRIDSSGNVGIGVVPSAWSGFRALQIGGTTSIWSSTSGNGSSFYSNNIYYNGSNRIYTTTGFATEYIQDSSAGSHIWFTAPSGTAGGTVTTTERMRIDSSGNVGIGVSPATRFHTQGGRVRIDANSENFALQLNNSTTANGCFLGSAGADTFVISASSGAERMRIASTGALGFSGANYGTSGQVLTSNGSGSAPSWTTPSTSSGTVTSVATGNGLQGGTITTSGTLSIAAPGFNTVGSYCFANRGLPPNQSTNPGDTFSATSQGAYPGWWVAGGTLSGTWRSMNNSVGSDQYSDSSILAVRVS